MAPAPVLNFNHRQGCVIVAGQAWCYL